jgi:hypothetical protein
MNLIVSKLRPYISISNFWQIFWPPIVVFACHVVLLLLLNTYNIFPNIDILMHYLGGLSMGYSCLLGLFFLQRHQLISPLDKLIELGFVFTLVATIAVFWEFGEFLIDHFLGRNVQVSLANTMQDLLMGILGALTLVVYQVIRKSKSDKESV